MKLGVLTFHSQLNYGGVLQCWALVQALKGLGHDVQVIDRWESEDNRLLLGPFSSRRVGPWLKILVQCIFGCGMLHRVIRHLRTMRFVKRIGLTPYHFVDWQDAPKNLELECVVVGSDQVWHGGDWGDPRPYLLEGAPNVRAVAYAASFGLKTLPSNIDYRRGFNRFSAISVREKSGARLIRETAYPHHVEHVVDPTMLIDGHVWGNLSRRRIKRHTLVCYFLSEPIDDAILTLERWARRTGWRVEFICDSYLRPLPLRFREAITRMGRIVLGVGCRRRVHLGTAFGPQEFVRAFSQAEACITDSFHAIMFSQIYGLNLRFIRPRSEMRKLMFERITELKGTQIRGDFISDNLVDALTSLLHDSPITFNNDEILKQRVKSLKWLQEVLAK